MPIYPNLKKNMGQTKNSSGKFKPGQPVLLVMHYTASGAGKGSADFLFGAHKPASSAHFVVDRNGDVYQLSDTGMTTWHAGQSFWKGMNFINGYGIGIEIANFGYWRPGIGITQEKAKADGWVAAKHKNGGPEYLWEPYPEAQMVAVEKLTAWILEAHTSIREIVGHDDIAPKRKVDPGPAFPMQRFKVILSPRVEGSVIPKGTDGSKSDTLVLPNTRYATNVNALNLRGGPGTNFEVLVTMKRGTVVNLLQEKDDWSFVETGTDKSKREGWVLSQYITPA